MGGMKKVTLFLFLLFLSAGVLGSTIPAFAGASDSYIVSDASVTDGQINTGDFLLNGDVTAEGKTICLGSNSKSASVVAKTKINNLGEYGVKEMFSASMRAELSEFAEKGSFSIGFAMKRIGGGCQTAGAVELRFYEDGGLWFSAYEYYADGIYAVLAEPRQYSDIQAGDSVEISLRADTQNRVTLTFNTTAVLTEKQLRGDASGYFGLFSEGRNDISVGGLSVTAYSYQNPENADYTETFDNDAYNANMFYSESKASPLSPSKLSAEDGQLYFCNTAGAYFSTRYRYSNFELQFDLTDLRREPEYDERGNITGTISGWFGLAFGVNEINLSADETIRQSAWLHFEGLPTDVDHSVPYPGARYVMYDSFTARKVQAMEFNLWDKDFIRDRTVNIRLSVTDGLVRLYMKFEGEKDWGEPQFEYDLGFTPTGYIRIFTWGETSIHNNGLKFNSAANFKIDNFSVKNTDYEGVKQSVDAPPFKSNVIAGTPDFEYSDSSDDGDLIGNRLENGEEGSAQTGCSSSETAGAMLAAVTGLGAAYCLFMKR